MDGLAVRLLLTETPSGVANQQWTGGLASGLVLGQVGVKPADDLDGPALELVVAALCGKIGIEDRIGKAHKLGPRIEVTQVVLGGEPPR